MAMASMSRLVKQWKPISRRLLSRPLCTMWVNNFGSILEEATEHERLRPEATGDKHHWLVLVGGDALEFDSHQALYDDYIQSVASVVNSKEAAKQKIYLASCQTSFGFGVCLDETQIIKLERIIEPLLVVQDFYHAARPKDSPVVPQFTTRNQNRRLDNIFSYQRLSEPSVEWNSNYWLVTVRRPYGGLADDRIAAIKFCIKILADVVGSEDAAKKMIYMVWFEKPHGFAAKMDEDTLNKLKVAHDVMTVHPDYSFDVKNESDGMAVLISS